MILIIGGILVVVIGFGMIGAGIRSITQRKDDNE